MIRKWPEKGLVEYQDFRLTTVRININSHDHRLTFYKKRDEISKSEYLQLIQIK